MKFPRLLFAPALCFLTAGWIPVHADEAPQVGSITVLTTPITGVAAKLQPFIDSHELPGAVTLLATKDHILNFETLGLADVEKRVPMRQDTIFWIASMTKPMTAVCVAMLADEGKLSFEDSVEKYLPEFRDAWMLDGDATPQKRTLSRPARVVTIRDLLTHTAGIADLSQPQPHATLGEMVAWYGREPLQFQPGSKWKYSTAGINMLGRIVEVVSGTPFEQFLQDRVCAPLGMRDTTFWPTEAQAPRVAKSYSFNKQTKQLEPAAVYFMDGAPLTDRKRTPKPGGGLYSTALDVARFYQMMLRGGLAEDGRTRLLKAETAKTISTTQTPDEIKTGFTEGMSWGLGFQVVKNPVGVTGMLHPGTFGHGGAFGTASWADPERDLIYVMMIARAGLGNGDGSEIRKTFQEAASAAVK